MLFVYAFQVFVVDVYVDGLKHTVERRYSEFEEMHRVVGSFDDFIKKTTWVWKNLVDGRTRILVGVVAGWAVHETDIYLCYMHK